MNPRPAFAAQARNCRDLGSPLTARVCDLLGEGLQRDQGEVARRALDWPGDTSSRGASVPLRLAGALHALVLTGRAPDLAAAYARGTPDLADLLAAIAAHEGTVMGWLDSPPQTNEVGRSAALLPAARFAAAHAPLPLALMELGASAGLNLNFPLYRLDTDADAAQAPVVLRPEWRGEPAPAGDLRVTSAEGVDLRPVDALRDATRLLAYCWPDQPARMERLRAALRLAAHHPPQLSAGDAADWLEDRLTTPLPGRLRMVYHTVAWQYFPPETQARSIAALHRAGAQATPDTPLAHIAMEADATPFGAALHLRLWDGRLREWSLGRADFHGRWMDWQPRLADPASQG